MTAEIEFDTYRDAVDHVRWLRTNLSDRGTDWDFTYSSKSNKVFVRIDNHKIATWYRLAFPQATFR